MNPVGDDGGARARARRARAPRRHLATVAATLLLCLLGAAPALAQPVWQVDGIANSTVAPGDQIQYVTQILNVGDAPTDGSDYTLTIALPDHVTGVSVALNNFPIFVGWTCTAGDGSSPVLGASVIQCTSSFAINPQQGFFLTFPVITAAVDGSASGTLTAQLSLSGGGASNTATTVVPVRVSDAAPHFGVTAFDGATTADAAGDPLTQAGGHPYDISTSIDFATATSNVNGPASPVEPPKDVLVDLPPGFVGFPTAADRCSASDLANSNGAVATPLCVPTSQVGTARVRTNALGKGFVVQGPIPVYDMATPPDVPARFGFNLDGTVVTMDAQLRSDGDYGLSVNARDLSEAIGVAGTTLTFWGVPSDASHDAERACSGQQAPWQGGSPCPSGGPRKAFLRNPTSCTPAGAGLVTTVHADSWVHPSDPVDASFTSHAPPGYPFPPVSDSPPSTWGGTIGIDGCEKVPFDPSLRDGPTSVAHAAEPAGFSFDLSLPQSSDPDSIGEGDLRTAVVTLPAGLRVSPSSASGLQACSPAQIGLLGTTFPEPNRIRFSTADAACPNASKIGTVTLRTPLLDQPLSGSIYLASPHDNPFGTLLSIYLVVNGPGVVIKLPGKIEANGANGQLTATFDDNPQLPFDDLHLEFKDGPRAPLTMPDACGTYTTHAVLTSWSAGKQTTSDATFTVDQGPGGAPCAARGFAPGFSAGTQDPVAGADSSFLLSLSRGDGDQELGSVAVDMPTGVTGRIKNAALCASGPAAAGTCPEASRIGGVAVSAGAGSSPFYIGNGRAYLTGPYRGAPFGLSMAVPAIAGPFDLGTVVVRAAIQVDRHSAQLKVVSDPLPTILDGIPLDLREVRVAIDRPHFIVNPTSCAQKHVLGTVGSVDGAIAHVSSRFEVGECGALRLAPKISFEVGGRHHTGARVSTPLTTTLTQTAGQADLRSVAVTLPTTLSALLPVINRACTQAAYQAGRCAGARAGSATAVTPLLRHALRGSVYFVRSGRALPDLVVALRGQVSIDLVGRVSIPGGTHLATRFGAIPDVPLTKFVLRLVSGRNGPLGNATSLCTARARRATASVAFTGQNGDTLQVHPRLRIRGCTGRAKG